MSKKITTEQTVAISIEEWVSLAAKQQAPAVTIRLNGSSMLPLVRKNQDLVTIVPLTGAIRTGEIVLFCGLDGRFVVHRVRRIKDGWVLTLGDHCRRPDGWIPERDVLGRVIRVKRDRRIISTDHAFSRFCGRIWMYLLPVRQLPNSSYQRYRRWKKKLCQKNK